MALTFGTRPVALLFSGGLDSAILLGDLLANNHEVIPIHVRTESRWQECELRAARKFHASVSCAGLSDLVVLDMPVRDLYGDHWSITGIGVPDRFSADDAVFLPGRNPLMLIKPALWCRYHGIERLSIATLAANPFDDATPEFFASFETMIAQATGQRVEIARPFEGLTKRQVMRLGASLPLEHTFSCLNPWDGNHCGVCNKCGERRSAFRDAGVPDLTCYAESPETS